MGNVYEVRTNIFTGPLELLLHLIEKRKLHINDIALAAVTDDFLAYLREQQNISISHSANFVWVASTLLLIKSRSLLPALSLTEEEEGDIRSLEYRLKLYKLFKKLFPSILEHFGKNMLFTRAGELKMEPVFSPDSTCSIPYLYASAQAVIKNLPQKTRLPQVVVEQVISLEEMIEQLSERIAHNLSLSFQQFVKEGTKSKKAEKVTVIVGFLAMLELVKRGILNVKQEARFEDITMETEQVDTPRYT